MSETRGERYICWWKFAHKSSGFQPEGQGALSPGQAASAPPWVHGLQPSSLKGCEPRVGNVCCQPFRLKSFLRYNPGRRRKASSPWAEFCQAFSLKTKNARTVNQFSTNSHDAHPKHGLYGFSRLARLQFRRHCRNFVASFSNTLR